MTELYLMRHGQTAANKRGIYCGKTDIALTQEGIRQAREAAKHLPQFKHVYSSDLLRAKQTAKIVAPKARIRYTAVLREIDFGDFEGYSADEIQDLMPDAWQRYLDDYMVFTFPNGDTVKQYLKNATATIQRIVDAHVNERVLVVSHKGFILAAVSHFLHGDCMHMFDDDIRPSGYIMLRINKDKATISKEKP